MKTIQISVERNFHIKDDDRFLMEKISATTTIEEDESALLAINTTRELIVESFKRAYPHLKTYLNFDEVIQVNKPIDKRLLEIHTPPVTHDYNTIPTHNDESFNEREHWQNPPEKINKGTIEEQIEACTSLDELKTFKYVAEMNSKLNLLFHGKENELSLKKML